jgi:hypothetical protein
MVALMKDTRFVASGILAMMLIAGMLALVGTAAATGDTSETSDDATLGDGDTLFLVTPAQYRLVFRFGNPILFGVATPPLTALTYEDGSGLSNIIKLDLTDGTHIIHADAPAVTENAVYELTLIATHGAAVETLTLTIYVGDYPVTVDYGDGEDEDGGDAKLALLIGSLMIVIFFLAFILGGALLGKGKYVWGALVCVGSAILFFIILLLGG